MAATYFLANLEPLTTSARRWRLRVPVFGLFKWRLPACLRLSFPEAVTRKRFLEPLWVFIFGIDLYLAERLIPSHSILRKKQKPWPLSPYCAGQGNDMVLKLFRAGIND